MPGPRGGGGYGQPPEGARVPHGLAPACPPPRTPPASPDGCRTSGPAGAAALLRPAAGQGEPGGSEEPGNGRGLRAAPFSPPRRPPVVLPTPARPGRDYSSRAAAPWALPASCTTHGVCIHGCPGMEPRVWPWSITRPREGAPHCPGGETEAGGGAGEGLGRLPAAGLTPGRTGPAGTAAASRLIRSPPAPGEASVTQPLRHQGRPNARARPSSWWGSPDLLLPGFGDGGEGDASCTPPPSESSATSGCWR